MWDWNTVPVVVTCKRGCALDYWGWHHSRQSGQAGFLLVLGEPPNSALMLGERRSGYHRIYNVPKCPLQCVDSPTQRFHLKAGWHGGSSNHLVCMYILLFSQLWQNTLQRSFRKDLFGARGFRDTIHHCGEGIVKGRCVVETCGDKDEEADIE